MTSDGLKILEGGQSITEGHSLEQALFLFQFQLKFVGEGDSPDCVLKWVLCGYVFPWNQDATMK